MILLSDDILQVVNGSAVTIDAHVSFTDQDGRKGRQNTNLTAAATYSILDESDAGAREIEDLNIHNKGSAGSALTLQIVNASTTFVLWSGTLEAGTRLTFVDGVGFVASTPAKLDSCKYVTANSVHVTAATFAAMTGLTFPVVAGKIYAFELQLFHIADATTTGATFAIGGVTATFITVGSMSVVTAGVATTTMSSGVVTAVATAIIAQTTSSTAATVPTMIAGTIQPSASGTLEFQAASEVTVAAGLTVIKGSWAHMREVDN